MKTNLIIGIVAVVALILGIVAIIGGGVVKEITQVSGVVGPDNPGFTYWSINGVRVYSDNQAAKAATTTICSFQNKTGATTTVLYAGVKFTISSTTASRIYIGKGTTPNATTTALGVGSLAANAQGVIVASSSPLTYGQDDAMVVAPNHYINFGMATEIGTANNIGTFSPTANCKIMYLEN